MDLKTSISSRRECLVEKYGPDPTAAFTDADPLDIPRLADEVQQEALTKMEAALKAAKKQRVRQELRGNQREGPRRASQTAGESEGETAQSGKKTTGCSE